MGNICQNCLKEKIKAPQQLITTEEAMALKNFDLNNQIISSNTLFSVETQTIAQLDVDDLIIFADNPYAIFNNSFINKLGTSANNILREKLAQTQSKDKVHLPTSSQQFTIKIADPFYNNPIKRLLIVGFKVWDGKANQKNYIKSVMQRALNSSLKNSTKKSLGIIQIEQQLGYSIDQFQRIFISKLREETQASNKLAQVIYVTSDKRKGNKILKLDIQNSMKSSECSQQNKSNYY